MKSQSNTSNKRKIINDPVHGFITIPNELIFDLIEHPFFQRLRRIKQLGLSHLVYPGANHTRFHHALGAMHLMQKAITVLKKKGIEISDDEKTGAIAAILLHDIGHGPFSHTLEHALLNDVHHEEISVLFMQKLNEELDGQLDTAIQIFTDQHPKKFLHQLVSSQLDMDRLDYLQRDSFFTGVSEGVIGSERIIKMLNVSDDQLVVDEKGIYSIENFLNSRRIMYWQVYMHKTVVSSEYMLTSILKRARKLYHEGKELFCTPSLEIFLKKQISATEFKSDASLLENFALIDDNDIISSVKVWQKSDDLILSTLCKNMIGRKLFKTEISSQQFSSEEIQQKEEQIVNALGINQSDVSYFVISEKLVNNAYNHQLDRIHVLSRDGKLTDLLSASDNFNLSGFTKSVEKFSLCYLRIKTD
ncbi:MAG: HD domain-containing protein [Flavobacteriales bacterium]|nr:HD domain-containing protein [Flavobacteriales bacterium]